MLVERDRRVGGGRGHVGFGLGVGGVVDSRGLRRWVWSELVDVRGLLLVLLLQMADFRLLERRKGLLKGMVGGW